MAARPAGLFIPAYVLWTIGIGAISATGGAVLMVNTKLSALEQQMETANARLDRLEQLLLNGGF